MDSQHGGFHGVPVAYDTVEGERPCNLLYKSILLTLSRVSYSCRMTQPLMIRQHGHNCDLVFSPIQYYKLPISLFTGMFLVCMSACFIYLFNFTNDHKELPMSRSEKTKDSTWSFPDILRIASTISMGPSSPSQRPLSVMTLHPALSTVANQTQLPPSE